MSLTIGTIQSFKHGKVFLVRQRTRTKFWSVCVRSWQLIPLKNQGSKNKQLVTEDIRMVLGGNSYFDESLDKTGVVNYGACAHICPGGIWNVLVVI